jgi:Fur family transcriptional regulator, iron response regulator
MDELSGISEATIRKLQTVGLRPTRQRLAIAALLFGHGDRHVSAEQLYNEVCSAKIKVSLATIYNALHQFTDAGLLREISIEGSRSYFDTNVTSHFHMLDETSGELSDIDQGSLRIVGLPSLPADKELSRIDVIVRLKQKT